MSAIGIDEQIEETYRELEPAAVWRHFAALNRIPRPSGREAAARDYVRQVAETAGCRWQTDARGNTVVFVPARGAVAGEAPAVAVQAHLDMVCEKRPDVAFDFAHDAIRPVRRGNRIYADGTTLGADNGIGAAMALALIDGAEVTHGPLELLFTVEEETGLLGALELDTTPLRSRLLINLDSEDPEELTIGCAGGGSATLRLPLTVHSAPAGAVGRAIVVAGLSGGHSGVQIHEPRANAIQLLAQVLNAVEGSGIPFSVAALSGGSAHNAIPRDARAEICLQPEQLPAFDAAVSRAATEVTGYWQADEPAIRIETQEIAAPAEVLSADAAHRLLALLTELPHGVLEMSETFPGKVETSCNLARVQTEDGVAVLLMSVRSFLDAEIRAVLSRISVIADRHGAAADIVAGYPGWAPDADSRLLTVTRETYVTLHDGPPAVEVVHAGLECGVIVSRAPGMEAVSFGPLIRGAHSPDEYVDIPSVASTWQLLTALLAALTDPAAGR